MRLATPCATCQHLGDAAFPCIKYDRENDWTPILVGFSDRPNGEPVEYPSRRCNHPKMKNVLVYDALEHPWSSCQYWEKRTWMRPETCGECKFKRVYLDTDINHCACTGHPYIGYHEWDEKACINGQVDENTQLTLF